MRTQRTLMATAFLAVSLGFPDHAQSQGLLVNVGPSPGLDQMALAPEGVQHALKELPGVVRDIMQRSQVPGVAVAVVHQGKTVFVQGFGVRQLGKPEPVTPETVFLVASVSKPLTGSLIATQVSQGKVQWNDPVTKYLPDFTLADTYVSRHASIGDFMAHRTGLPAAAGDDLEDLGYSRQEILSRLHMLPLDDFRLSYHYANFGTTTAAQAVAAATGKPWETLIEEALFRPLGMSATSARHSDFKAQPNRAVQHALEGGRFQALYDRNADAQAPAGGVSSNVLDLSNWLAFLLASGTYQGEQLASPQALVPAMLPQALSGQAASADARSAFYGYGFNVGVEPNGRTMISHSGAFLLGTGTHFRLLPSADLGIVVLTNGSPVGAAESIASEFTDRVQFGKPLRDWYGAYEPLFRGMREPIGDLVGKQPPVKPQPAGELVRYVGTYKNDYFGQATVTVSDQTLYLALGPRGLKVDLKHWDGDTFAIAPVSENEPKGSLSSIIFTREQGEDARGFVIDYLNDNRLAHWVRIN